MTSPAADIALEVHICNQRRSYRATFSTEAQAIAFIEGRSSTHACHELDDQPIPATATALLETLYPTCEHGMSRSNCYGPQHYWYDEEEQARGLLNS